MLSSVRRPSFLTTNIKCFPFSSRSRSSRGYAVAESNFPGPLFHFSLSAYWAEAQTHCSSISRADDNVEYLWLERGEVYFEVPVALRGHTVRILCVVPRSMVLLCDRSKVQSRGSQLGSRGIK